MPNWMRKVTQRTENGATKLFWEIPPGSAEKGDELIGYFSPQGYATIALAPKGFRETETYPKLRPRGERSLKRLTEQAEQNRLVDGTEAA